MTVARLCYKCKRDPAIIVDTIAAHAAGLTGSDDKWFDYGMCSKCVAPPEPSA